MKSWKTLLLIAAFAGLTPLVAVPAFSADTESLPEALAKAYLTNPDLRAQRAALRAVDEQVARANLEVLPSVSANGSWTWVDRTTTVGTDVTPLNTLNQFKQLRVDQPLFNGFQRVFNRAQARALVRAGRAQLLQTEQNVLLSGVTVYMDVLRDESIFGLNQNNVQVLQRQKDYSDARFQVGEVTRTDTAQSDASLSGAITQRITAQANLAASRATYRQVIGDFPGTLEPAPGLPPLPGTLEEAWAVAIEQNPRVMIAMYNEEAAGHAVSASKGVLLPSANGFAAIDRFTGGTTFGADVAQVIQDNRSAGIQVNIPIFSGGKDFSDIRRNKQIDSQRKLEIVSAQNAVRAEAETAWMRFQAAVSSITSNQAQVDANSIAFEGTKQEESVGARTVLDVLNANQAYLNSQVNLVTANRDQYVAAFTLLSALGQLNAKTLDLPVELYDPEENYKNVRYKFWGWGTKDYE
jgi:outer membrane protein